MAFFQLMARRKLKSFLKRMQIIEKAK